MIKFNVHFVEFNFPNHILKIKRIWLTETLCKTPNLGSMQCDNKYWHLGAKQIFPTIRPGSSTKHLMQYLLKTNKKNHYIPNYYIRLFWGNLKKTWDYLNINLEFTIKILSSIVSLYKVNTHSTVLNSQTSIFDFNAKHFIFSQEDTTRLLY